MRIESAREIPVPRDEWLEAQCRRIEAAGKELARVVGQINLRTEQARAGTLGRRSRVTESCLRRVEAVYRTFHTVQVEIQNALFDCEHELRELREREVNPAELLIDGERLINRYRFLRRRARVIDGLLAYLPVVTHRTAACLEHLKRIRHGSDGWIRLTAPDCAFAAAALEELNDDSAFGK